MQITRKEWQQVLEVRLCHILTSHVFSIFPSNCSLLHFWKVAASILFCNAEKQYAQINRLQSYRSHNAFLQLPSQRYHFPLHCLLSFFHFLKDYHEEHPEVTVLDPPNAIKHLNNRQSMLEEVADLNLSNFYGNDAVRLFFLMFTSFKLPSI